MTREQLLQRTTGTKRLQLRGQDLNHFDFSGLDLSNADFRFADLRRANFEGTTLREADLSFANLRGANFENADLTNANLRFGDVSNANLKGATLTGTKLNFMATDWTGIPSDSTEPVSLTKLLARPFWGLLIGSVLSALLFYGASGIIYFTNIILTTKDPLIAGLNRFIAWQNITEGITIFILAWLMSGRLDNWFRTNWMRHLVFSIATIPVFMVVSLGSYRLLGRPFVKALEKGSADPLDNSTAPWQLYILASLAIGNLFLYALRQGRSLTRKMTEQEYQLLNMEKLKNRAELDALQAKINPHFLYNALNSIASLVHEDPDKAETMTLHLSKLFRYSTGRDGSHFSSLADEIDMVKTYLQVEAVRFGDRLTFTISPISVAISQTLIPQFLLQPIVENAIKHGIAKRADNGLIDIQITLEDGWLTLCVHDNGPAFPETMGGGYGLRSIQDKLRLLYGEAATVTLQNEPLKQVIIKLKAA
ncbi:histidine kinase [Fibrella aquatica]|uniref:histidine kinase n=1 Tax=Fibrella aquatica TaxID=3242487 RepID=UPI0035229E8D